MAFFRKKTGNWAYGLGIAWGMSIFLNLRGYGFHKINLKKSPAAGCFLIYTLLKPGKWLIIPKNLGIDHAKTWELTKNGHGNLGKTRDLTISFRRNPASLKSLLTKYELN